MMRPLLRHRPEGFTLVELLFATALVATLMVGVLQVTLAFAASQKRMVRVLEAPVWQGRLVDLVRSDLVHAVRVKTAGNEVTLDGLRRLHGEQAMPNHEPTSTTYRVVQAGDRSCLIREQTEILHDEQRWFDAGLVAVGVSSFGLTMESSVPNAGSADGDGERISLGEGPVVVRLSMVVEEQSGPRRVERRIVLR